MTAREGHTPCELALWSAAPQTSKWINGNYVQIFVKSDLRAKAGDTIKEEGAGGTAWKEIFRVGPLRR